MQLNMPVIALKLNLIGPRVNNTIQQVDRLESIKKDRSKCMKQLFQDSSSLLHGCLVWAMYPVSMIVAFEAGINITLLKLVATYKKGSCL